MQSKLRAREVVSAAYFSNRRRGHASQISISDSNHHVTEAIGDMYGDSDDTRREEGRPRVLTTTSEEVVQNDATNSYFETSPKSSSPESPLSKLISNDRYPPTPNGSPTEQKKSEPGFGSNYGATSPPPLTRTSSSDTATHHFPLNDIDYESSPAAVAQELSNLQAIRRMSMNVDAADPDLPSFGATFAVPNVPPPNTAAEDDASRLFWVPARLHPELAPKEFKTFVEERVGRIRRRSGEDDLLSPGSMERRGSASSLGRRRSMLSRTIDNPVGYTDGADVLGRKRSESSRINSEGSETTLHELESLVNDPSHLVRTVTTDTARRSPDTGSEVPATEDMPILPSAPVGQSLKRSTRTTYRRGSLRKAERSLGSRRTTGRPMDGDVEDPPPVPNVPLKPLSRVQTEPSSTTSDQPASTQFSSSKSRDDGSAFVRSRKSLEDMRNKDSSRHSFENGQDVPPPKVFQSRIATNGRTTAPLPGLKLPSDIPRIIETPPPPEARHVAPVFHQMNHPQRKSSFEFSRGVTAQNKPSVDRISNRPPLTRAQTPTQTLDEMIKTPSPMPGANTSTDTLSFIPTYTEDKKVEKKAKEKKDPADSGARKTSWGWLLGGEEKDKDKERKEKEDKEATKKVRTKLTKLPDKPHESTRLDVLQNASEGLRGRESVVLDRDLVKLEEERRKDYGSRKLPDGGAKKDKSAEPPSLFSSLFGGGKKKADKEGTSKKHTSSGRGLSPERIAKVLRADIDYNWTRFSILEERAIYRMAHIKLANPRRALYSQVLLSNFMYSYLAKVQQMHPQIQIPQFVTQKQGQKKQDGKTKEEKQSEEFTQWQRYQDQQQRGLNSGHDMSSTNSSFGPTPHKYDDDYNPEHQAQEDVHVVENYSDGYHEGPSPWEHSNHQRDPYAQKGLFDNTRPPEDDDMW